MHTTLKVPATANVMIQCSLLGLLLGQNLSGFAPEIKVIANGSVKVSHLSSADLRGIFWETKTLLEDGSHVEPVLLKSGDAHEAFVKEYTGKTTAALETYYRSLVFTGKGTMPRSFASEVELVDYVTKTKGAIGYVSAGASTDGVKILRIE